MGQGGSLVPVLTPGRLFCLLAERRDGRIPFVIQDDDHTVTGELDASAVIAMVSFAEDVPAGPFSVKEAFTWPGYPI